MPRDIGCHLKLNRVSKSEVSSQRSNLSYMHLLTTDELFPGQIINYMCLYIYSKLTVLSWFLVLF
jgi:hypothetical protein